MIFRVSSAHEEGGDRVFSVSTKRFIGENGVLTGLEIVEVEWKDGRPVEIAGTERVIPADLVTLAMGFVGPEADAFCSQMGLERDERGNLVRDGDYATKVPGVFVAGDAGRGQSLIVGRSRRAGRRLVHRPASDGHHEPAEAVAGVRASGDGVGGLRSPLARVRWPGGH